MIDNVDDLNVFNIKSHLSVDLSKYSAGNGYRPP